MLDQNIKTNNDEIKFECPNCGEELNIEALLCKYGPEGLYDLAERLKRAADEDVSDAMGETDCTILDYYMKGFNDELRGTSVTVPSSYMLERAYRMGAEHAIIGDDDQSLDLFDSEEILKMIKNS